MSRESLRWCPSRWSWQHIKRTKKRVMSYALGDLCELVGPHKGVLLMAELRASLDSTRSKEELKALGIRTLSDGTDLCPPSKIE